eukprot:7238442-Prymnesium_polylepis.1
MAQGGQVGYGAARKHGEGRTRRDRDVRGTDTLTAGGRVLEDVRDGGSGQTRLCECGVRGTKNGPAD